jgi:hypothetical protein
VGWRAGAYACFGRLGLTVILSHGHLVFQPRKIERPGIRRAAHIARRGYRRGHAAPRGIHERDPTTP